MRCIAVVNQKGGTGKTTTVVNLAAALAASPRRRVLVVDLDPQASATSWLDGPEGSRGLLDLFVGGDGEGLAKLAEPTSVDRVDLVPASSWMVGIERAIASEVGAELILATEVERLDPDRWEFVLFDCPPALGVLSVGALAASREVLVPVQTRAMPLEGLANLTQTIDRVSERLAPDVRLSHILACQTNWTNLSREVVERLRERFGSLVMKSAIRETVALAEAPSYRQPINEYAPGSRGAVDYAEAAAELVRRRPRE